MVEANQKGSPTPAEFETMLTFIGEHLGLSQFGSKFGFGRFQVVSIEVKNYTVKESKIVITNPA